MKYIRYSVKLLKKKEEVDGDRMVKLSRSDGIVGGVDACQVPLHTHPRVFILIFKFLRVTPETPCGWTGIIEQFW
jgi:hypothetical protein